jgi:hypothetical protein
MCCSERIIITWPALETNDSVILENHSMCNWGTFRALIMYDKHFFSVKTNKNLLLHKRKGQHEEVTK